MAKILIAVPTFENITPDTFKSVFDLERGEHEVLFEYVRGYDCATARNRIAQKAIDMNADYVLMADNDVVLPKDTLLTLLDGAEEVNLGYYAHRGNDNRYNGRTCICRLNQPDGKPYYNYPLESEYTAEEMRQMREDGQKKFPVHGGGMGCALIATGVFRKIPYPWYDWVNYGDANRGMLSEDLYFCELCRSYGVTVYADARAACGHLFRYVQWPE